MAHLYKKLTIIKDRMLGLAKPVSINPASESILYLTRKDLSAVNYKANTPIYKIEIHHFSFMHKAMFSKYDKVVFTDYNGEIKVLKSRY